MHSHLVSVPYVTIWQKFTYVLDARPSNSLTFCYHHPSSLPPLLKKVMARHLLVIHTTLAIPRKKTCHLWFFHDSHWACVCVGPSASAIRLRYVYLRVRAQYGNPQNRSCFHVILILIFFMMSFSLVWDNPRGTSCYGIILIWYCGRNYAYEKDLDVACRA